MRKISLLLMVAFAIGFTASAQKVTTKVIDNKGTIKWVLDSSTAVITKADTSLMLSSYLNDANNGLTKNGQTVELGGNLNRQTTIHTTAANFLALTGLQDGDASTDSLLVVSPVTGQVKVVAAKDLIEALNFTNGITKDATNNVKLGGALTEPTTITTDATNVLKLAGLQSGSLTTDSLVVSSADGTLKRVSAGSIALQSGDQNFGVAVNGQSTFTVADMPATASKVWVYRNGAKLLVDTDYTTTAGVVTLTGAMTPLVVVGDVIEVQWVK
jgi:hypothetical protein